MISCNQLRTYVIQPVLHHMGIYADYFEELLISTCAQETSGGTYLHQIHGPACGLYEMEHATSIATWNAYKLFVDEKDTFKINTPNNDIDAIQQRRKISSNKDILCDAVKYYITYSTFDNNMPDFTQMTGNLYFATIMASLNYYLRSKQFLELKNKDIKSLWNIYKPFWNTEAGKATFEEFERNYLAFIKT